MRLTSIGIAATLLAVGGTATTAPAVAAAATTCTDGVAQRVVTGDLIVPSGESCSLQGTRVRGAVVIEPGADLVIDGGYVGGPVQVGENAFLDAFDTRLDGTVRAQGAYGVYLEGGSVAAVVGRPAQDSADASFYYLQDTRLSTNLNTAGGEVFVAGTTILGSVVSNGALFTDILDSSVRGTLDVRANEFGAVVCESEIYGDARYTRNQQAIQIGPGDGSLGECVGPTFWGGNLTMNGNDAAISVVDNVIVGNLGGSGNSPAPSAADNRVRGEMRGQFAQSAEVASTAADEPRPSADRGSALRLTVEARRTDAGGDSAG